MFPPAPPTGVDDLGVEPLPLLAFGHHLRCIEHVDAGAIKRRGDLQAGRHIVAVGEQLLRFRQHEIEHQRGCIRMRRIGNHRNGVRMRHNRIKREPIDRPAFALELLGRVVEHGQRQRHLAHRHQIGEQRVPLAHREAVALGDVAKEFEALLLPHHLDETGEPVRVISLDRNLALPFRIEQVLIALRQVGLLHQIGVVGWDQHIQTEARPGSIGWDRGRHQVREIR
jgi:hypothetical protein